MKPFPQHHRGVETRRGRDCRHGGLAQRQQPADRADTGDERERGKATQQGGQGVEGAYRRRLFPAARGAGTRRDRSPERGVHRVRVRAEDGPDRADDRGYRDEGGEPEDEPAEQEHGDDALPQAQLAPVDSGGLARLHVGTIPV